MYQKVTTQKPLQERLLCLVNPMVQISNQLIFELSKLAI